MAVTISTELGGRTLTFETDTGSVWTLKDAWNAKPPELSKGDVSLVFQAVECLEG